MNKRVGSIYRSLYVNAFRLANRSGILKNKTAKKYATKAHVFAYSKLMGKDIVQLDVNDYKMYVTLKDFSVSLDLFLYHTWEPETTQLFRQIIKRDMVVLDMGAYIGYFTLLFSGLVGSGQVYAFEPQPANFDLLKKNIELNNLKNVIPVNSAVSDSKTKLRFSSNYASSSVSDKGDIEVDAIRIDDFLPKERKVDVVKLDVEGHELRALKGMERVLAANSDIKIVMEFGQLQQKEANVNPKDLLDFISERGFKFYQIGKEVNKITKEELLDAANRGATFNLLLKRE